VRKFGLFFLLGNVLWFAACGGNGGGSSTVTSVQVSCSPSIINYSQTSQCSASVGGTGNFNTAVTWSASTGTISSSGLYTPPGAMNASIQVTVTATSVQNTSVAGTASITVNPVTATGNVAPIIVDSGPDGQEVNIGYTTVKLCVPGTQTCQTIDHIQVDTGSEGLRLVSSVVNQITLPLQNSLYECLVFADGYVWGPIATADVTVGGETASSVPVHLTIPAGSSPPVPGTCSSQTSGGNEGGTPSDLGANGILGVGPFQTDCGQYCVVDGAGCGSSSQPCVYYSCPGGQSCSGTDVSENQQVPNPVVLFTATGDNNGVLIQMPSLADSNNAGTNIQGSLIFGINTQSNNNLSLAANTYPIPDSTNNSGTIVAGDIITAFNGQTYPQSFIDSGSNGLFFLDASLLGIPVCSAGGSGPNWYCPNSPFTPTLTNQGQTNNGPTGSPVPVSVTIGNADSLFATNNTAYSTLGGPIASPCSTSGGTNPVCAFDFGLPFFYGRNVFTAIDQAPVQGAPTGPFFAY